MNKPQLADVSALPFHPTWRHPITGAPIQALGHTRNGRVIWPVMGGSQPLGGPAPGTVQPQAGVPGGQQPVTQFVSGLGGHPVPVLAPGGQVPLAGPQPGQQPGQVPVPMFGQTLGGVPVQPYAQPGAVATLPPWIQPAQVPAPPAGGGYTVPVPGGGTWVFGTQQPGVQPGQQMPGQMPGQQQPGVQPVNGQQQPGVQPGQQQPGQQPQGGGQPAGTSDGAWDKPYPQKPLAEMTVEEQNTYWKYHNRKLEDRIRQMGDYEQLKQQLAQLQQMTQTEWQRAVLDAESRGRAQAMEQAAGQMVAVAFQGAAQSRMTPDQIHAQLGVLDAKRFVHNGQVDIAAIHAYVDTIAPARQTGLVPLLPNTQPGQHLPLQQVALGQPAGVALQPGQPGYGQQPTFGPIAGQQAGQHPYGQQFGQFPGQVPGQQPVLTGQLMPGQQGYGQVPIPGVPTPYQPAAQVPAPVVQAAGLNGLPGLPGLPAAADFGQGPAVQHAPLNAAQSGAAMAAARHGKTRSQQLAETRG